MDYAKRIKEKKYSWGGKAFATVFPTRGSVSVVGSVLGGTRHSSSHELSQVHADMLLGGTLSHTKKELQLLLDEMGATLSFFVTDERLGFSGRVLTKHLNAYLQLLSEVLREPLFPAEELALNKQRQEANLALEAQDTTRQANIALAWALFEKSHPNYAESTDEARKVLLSVTHASLLSLHKKIISRDSLVVSLAGDIAPQKAFVLCEKHFKTLPKKVVPLAHFKKATRKTPKKVAISIKHKASIDYVLGVTTGMTSNDKEYGALLLGLQILGSPSGFSGRLMKTVREEEGLTYGVYAYMSGFAHATDGYLCVWGTFAPQLLGKGRAAIKREVALIVRTGVTETETIRHREMFFLRSRVRLSTSGAFARAAHDTATQGKSLSHLDTFPKHIRHLTKAQVNKALKKYLVLGKMSEAAAGPVTTNTLSK